VARVRLSKAAHSSGGRVIENVFVARMPIIVNIDKQWPKEERAEADETRFRSFGLVAHTYQVVSRGNNTRFFVGTEDQEILVSGD
jgi:hypothetical protein